MLEITLEEMRYPVTWSSCLLEGLSMSFEIKYFSGALIIFSTLELCILWQIQYWVLVKYIHLRFELWDFAMDSACGHDPVEDNVFSSRISLNHPIEFFFCQFVPLCSSCYHPIIMLVSECSGARLSPMKAFPTPALLGFCLRSSLPFRPWPCGTSSLPGTCEQGPFCLSLCFCVVLVGISQPSPSLSHWSGHASFCPGVIQTHWEWFPLLSYSAIVRIVTCI